MDRWLCRIILESYIETCFTAPRELDIVAIMRTLVIMIDVHLRLSDKQLQEIENIRFLTGAQDSSNAIAIAISSYAKNKKANNALISELTRSKAEFEKSERIAELLKELANLLK